MDPETWKSLYYGSFAGLPVYTSKWMPENTMIVTGNRFGKTQALYDEAKRLMTNRPFRDQSDGSLSRILSDAIAANKMTNSKGPIQPKEYLGIRDLTDPLAMGTNVETEFRIGADGRPEAVTRLVDTPSKGAVRNAGESEMAWLKRRVSEIRWRPAR